MFSVRRDEIKARPRQQKYVIYFFCLAALSFFPFQLLSGTLLSSGRRRCIIKKS